MKDSSKIHYPDINLYNLTFWRDALPLADTENGYFIISPAS